MAIPWSLATCRIIWPGLKSHFLPLMVIEGMRVPWRRRASGWARAGIIEADDRRGERGRCRLSHRGRRRWTWGPAGRGGVQLRGRTGAYTMRYLVCDPRADV